MLHTALLSVYKNKYVHTDIYSSNPKKHQIKQMYMHTQDSHD